MDSDNEEEFQTKLESLKVSWEAREAEAGGSIRGSTFYKWFCKEKVGGENVIIYTVYGTVVRFELVVVLF